MPAAVRHAVPVVATRMSNTFERSAGSYCEQRLHHHNITSLWILKFALIDSAVLLLKCVRTKIRRKNSNCIALVGHIKTYVPSRYLPGQVVPQSAKAQPHIAKSLSAGLAQHFARNDVVQTLEAERTFPINFGFNLKLGTLFPGLNS